MLPPSVQRLAASMNRVGTGAGKTAAHLMSTVSIECESRKHMRRFTNEDRIHLKINELWTGGQGVVSEYAQPPAGARDCV